MFKAAIGKSIVRHRVGRKLDRVDNALQERPKANRLTAALDAGLGSYAILLHLASRFELYRHMDSSAE